MRKNAQSKNRRDPLMEAPNEALNDETASIDAYFKPKSKQERS